MKPRVKWIYQESIHHGVRTQSGQKPTLCFKGTKQMVGVAAGPHVRVLKRAVKDFTECRDVLKGTGIYPPVDAAKMLADVGTRNGITDSAMRLIQLALADSDQEIDEDEFEDEENIPFTNDGQPANTEETTMSKSKKTNGKKTNGKATTGKTTTTKVSAAKVAKPAKKAAGSDQAASGDGLGREGSVARFFNTRLVEGRTDDAELVAEARKAFPGKKIADTYAAWYRSALKKKGLLGG